MKSHGSVAINGVKASNSTLKLVSSYVEQEDALIGSLTVRETMDFAARLSLPRCAVTAKLSEIKLTSKAL